VSSPSGGDIKCAYDCDKESYKMADRLMAFVELQELKKALAESPSPRSDHAQGQEIQDVHPVGGLTQQNGLII
jgi:hypothetical protein